MYCIIPSIKVNFALNITEKTVFTIFKNKNMKGYLINPILILIEYYLLD